MVAGGVFFGAGRDATITSEADDAARQDFIFGVCGFDEGFDAATTPRRLRSGRAEPAGKLAEDGAIRTCGGQEDTDSGRALDDARGDLDETKPERRELGTRQRRALGNPIAHGKHEPISGGVKDQPELVGLWIAA